MTKTTKRPVRRKTFKEFKTFLVENCWDLYAYKDGLYDKTIYEWFMKPLPITHRKKK